MQIMHTGESKTEHPCPHSAVLLGILKAVETELRTRDLLGADAALATPLWFLAETERNIFLWRHGKSIDNARDFSFWVDTKALIHKRRSQLSRNCGFNPFINVTPCSGGIESENRYLDTVEELAERIFTRAHELSHASESVRASVSRRTLAQPSVLLPTCSKLRSYPL